MGSEVSAAAPVGPIRRFYVYALKTNDGRVFYIGKGTGGRALQHFSRSHSKLVDAIIANAEVGLSAEIISWHDSSADAEKEERRVIGSYSSGELLNVHGATKHDPGKKPTQEDVDRLAMADHPLDVLEEMLRWWPSFDAIAESVGRFLPDSCRPERRGVYAWLSRGLPRSRQLAFMRAVKEDFGVTLPFGFVEHITADRIAEANGESR